MNNENTSITTFTGQGDTFPSRYSSPSAGKREGIMKHTQKQIKTKSTKAKHEQTIIGLYGFDKLTVSPYYENTHDPYVKPKKLNLYYNDGEHIGTWGSGFGWYYDKAEGK